MRGKGETGEGQGRPGSERFGPTVDGDGEHVRPGARVARFP
ncbi:hypothetical protein SUDANB6_04608 [Streptomyces sp. enrichment culture]